MIVDQLVIQIEQFPPDLFMSEISNDSFLLHSVQSLFLSIEQYEMGGYPIDISVKKSMDILTILVSSRFNWDLQQECGEYAPVVVMEE